jgi:FMN phosphatase YigB (HAD superfamily)
MVRWLLWDLDGTLVHWKSPFLIPYVAWLHLRHLGPRHGYFATLRHVTGAYRRLLSSRGPERLNRVYLEELSRRFGADPEEIEREELAFVEEGLDGLRDWIAPVPGAKEVFGKLLEEGRYTMVAATNPTMPVAFNRLRLGWAGYDPDCFRLITGTETSTCLKRHPGFYRELLQTLGASPEECVMIGNDGRKDLIAAEVGIPVFLLENGFQVHLGDRPDLEIAGTGNYLALDRFLTDLGSGGATSG